MHIPDEVSRPDPLDRAADRVVNAYVDAFMSTHPQERPTDLWLQRLIEALEEARIELIDVLWSQHDPNYRRNLTRCVKRVEKVLNQLYEEQLHH